ncbi:MAG: tetratricopeptide (TPR) repeat protein [Granulosicoccus sp.]|jgi:tetratricopeptide (TPR) repeat protein
MVEIFVSYSREDRERVAPFVELLIDKGFSVWWDRDIHPGDSFEESIDKHILEAQCVVVMWSQHSVNSRWVKNEALEGMDRNILIPILLDDVRIPVAFKQAQSADFRGWPETFNEFELTTLLSSLHKILDKAPETTKRVVSPPFKAPKKPRLNGIAVSIAAVIIVAAIGFAYLYSSNGSNAEPESPSVAVLRFRDLSDPSATYLPDSLSSELHQRLSGVDQLNLRSQFASWDVPNSLDPVDAAGRLETRFLVYGKLIVGQPDARLEVRLVDSSGVAAWQREYRINPDQIQQLTQRIADHLVSALEIPLNDVGEMAISRYVTDDDDAYNAYLKGKDLLRQSSEIELLKQAEEQFLAATKADPRFVQAFSELCNVHLAIYEASRASSEFEQAEKACNRTLTLQSKQAEAHVALGNLYRYSGQSERGMAQIEKAIALQPLNADALIAQGYLFGQQRQVEALRSFTQAIAVQPGYWRSTNARGSFYFELGLFQQAIEDFTRVLLFKPNDTALLNNLGTSRYLNGEFPEAIEAWERSVSISPRRTTLSNLGTGFYFLREYEKAADKYQQAIALAPEDHRLWGNLADVQRMAGSESDAATSYQTAISLAMKDHAINDSDPTNLSRLAVYHAAISSHDDARKFLASALQVGGSNPFVHYDEVITHLLLGSMKEAATAYEKLKGSGFPATVLNADPMLDQLRG